MQELYYATSNIGKYSEVKQFLQTNYSSIFLKNYPAHLDELQTLDQRAVAIYKAEQAWKTLQKPVLVDDAGIYFEKYNQFPGVLTKFVCDGIGITGLLKLVEPGDKATFRIYLVYYYGPNVYQTFEAETVGSVVKPENLKINSSFPYDSLFLPDNSPKTFEQLRITPEIHEFNYRIKALKKFLHWYDSTLITEDLHQERSKTL